MKKKYNVLFLSSWYPNKNNPTLGIFVQRHAEAVALYNNVAVIYVCSDKNLKNKKYEIEEHTENIVVSIIVYYKKIESNILIVSPLLKLFYNLKYYRLAFKILKEKYFSPEIIHANVLFPIGIIALYFKLKYKLNYIITEHSTEYLPSDGRYKGIVRKIISRIIAHYSKAIMPVSNDLAMAMKSNNLNTNYRVIPNVFDENLFYPNFLQKSNEKIKIIHISALDEEQKNITGMLNTIKMVSSNSKKFELLIIGENENRKQLEKYAEKLGILNTFVFFVGLKQKEELASLLRVSDFFILFSNFENQPCVLIESIASGIPVIATNVGGVKEYINEKTGQLIEPKNETEFAKTIEWMMNNYNTFDKKQLHKFAIDNFSKQKIGNEFTALYQTILN